MALLDELKQVIDSRCFDPVPVEGKIAIEQQHDQAADGKTYKNWIQKLVISELEGDEIFLCFDKEDHKSYSPYLIGNRETITAKACDYIMLKPEGGEWTVLLGELKMGTGSFTAESVKKQIGGSLAFIEYISSILRLGFNSNELNRFKLLKVVVYASKLEKRKKQRRQGGAQKRVLTPIPNSPKIEPFKGEHSDIIKIGLPFNDDDRKELSISLNSFLCRC